MRLLGDVYDKISTTCDARIPRFPKPNENNNSIEFPMYHRMILTNP